MQERCTGCCYPGCASRISHINVTSTDNTILLCVYASLWIGVLQSWGYSEDLGWPRDVAHRARCLLNSAVNKVAQTGLQKPVCLSKPQILLKDRSRNRGKGWERNKDKVADYEECSWVLAPPGRVSEDCFQSHGHQFGSVAMEGPPLLL